MRKIFTAAIAMLSISAFAGQESVVGSGLSGVVIGQNGGVGIAENSSGASWGLDQRNDGTGILSVVGSGGASVIELTAQEAESIRSKDQGLVIVTLGVEGVGGGAGIVLGNGTSIGIIPGNEGAGGGVGRIAGQEGAIGGGISIFGNGTSIGIVSPVAGQGSGGGGVGIALGNSSGGLVGVLGNSVGGSGGAAILGTGTVMSISNTLTISLSNEEFELLLEAL